MYNSIIYFIFIILLISLIILYYNMTIHKINVEDFKNFNQGQV